MKPKVYKVTMKMVSEVKWYIEATSIPEAIELAKDVPIENGDEDILETTYKASVVSPSVELPYPAITRAQVDDMIRDMIREKD